MCNRTQVYNEHHMEGFVFIYSETVCTTLRDDRVAQVDGCVPSLAIRPRPSWSLSDIVQGSWCFQQVWS